MVVSTFDNKTFQWVLAIVISFLTALGGLVYNALDARLRVLEISGSPALRERLAKVETDSMRLFNAIDEIKDDQKVILELLRQHTELDGTSRSKR